MQAPSLTSIWYKPREIVRYLAESPASHIRLMAALIFIYFVQIAIFVLSLEKLTIAPLISLKGLLLILSSLVGLGFGSVAAIYAATLAIWLGAKCFNGQGTLPETRAAVLWALVWSIPIGFFLLLIHFTLGLPDWGVSLGIRIAAYLGILVTLVYGFIVLLKSVSEVQRFSLGYSFSSLLLATLLLAASVTIFFKIVS